MHLKRFAALVLTVAMLVIAGCSGAKPTQPATPEPPKPTNPWGIEKLVFGFVPSQDVANIDEKAKPMTDALSKELGVPITPSVGTNYVAVIEALGSKQMDVAFLPTLAYVLASKDYGVQPVAKTYRNSGGFQYRAQLTVRKEDKIPVCDQKADAKCVKTFEALKGKKIAFVDPTSTSGYLYPAAMLKDAGIDIEKGKFFSDVVMAGAHDAAVKAVYQKTVDAAWSFEDARDNLVKEFPDVKDKLVQVLYTTWIPNDTVSARKDLPKDFINQLQTALFNYAATDAGKAVLKSLYGIDSFVQIKDKDYDPVRQMAQQMNLDIKTEITKKK